MFLVLSLCFLSNLVSSALPLTDLSVITQIDAFLHKNETKDFASQKQVIKRYRWNIFFYRQTLRAERTALNTEMWHRTTLCKIIICLNDSSYIRKAIITLYIIFL